MPNISSVSLEDNIFGDTPELKNPSLSGNPALDKIFQPLVEEEFTKVRAASRWAQRFDPESYAKAQKLAPDLPLDTAARQLEMVEKIQRINA